MIITTFVLLALCTLRAVAQSTPWDVGEENTILCFTSLPSDDPTPPSVVQIAGLDFGFVNRIPTNLTADAVFNSSIRLTLQRAFYTNNTGVFLPDPSSEEFTQLCSQRLNPQNLSQPACTPPITRATCCVEHINWYSCPMTATYMPGDCMPYLRANATSRTVLSTSSTSLVGFPGETWSSGNLIFTEPGKYIILADIVMGNVQCAIGAIRTVVEPPPAVTTTTIFTAVTTTTIFITVSAVFASDSSATRGGFSADVIAGLSVGAAGVVAIAAVSAVLYAQRRRRFGYTPGNSEAHQIPLAPIPHIQRPPATLDAHLAELGRRGNPGVSRIALVSVGDAGSSGWKPNTDEG